MNTQAWALTYKHKQYYSSMGRPNNNYIRVSMKYHERGMEKIMDVQAYR